VIKNFFALLDFRHKNLVPDHLVAAQGILGFGISKNALDPQSLFQFMVQTWGWKPVFSFMFAKGEVVLVMGGIIENDIEHPITYVPVTPRVYLYFILLLPYF
jgi:hypothetical protein